MPLEKRGPSSKHLLFVVLFWFAHMVVSQGFVPVLGKNLVFSRYVEISGEILGYGTELTLVIVTYAFFALSCMLDPGYVSKRHGAKFTV